MKFVFQKMVFLVASACVSAQCFAVLDTYDVMVVGAGSAGVAAALQSGRAGASTLLVERGGQVGGNMTVKARVLVDCTGDGTLAAIAGARRMRGATVSPGSFLYTFSNGRELWSRCDKEKFTLAFNEALKNGELDRLDVPSRPGSMFEGVPSTSWNYVVDADSSDAKKRTQTNMRARASMLRVLRFLRRQPGMEDIRLGVVSAEVGVRESWRVVGDYIITCEDYVSGRVFDDSVCYAYYPVDLHSVESGVTPKQLEEGVVPTVPFRALCAEGVSNLLVAGRCVSADRSAASGLRVQGACMAMGQVTGQAAAMAAKIKCDVRKIDIEKLRSALSDSGAIVP